MAIILDGTSGITTPPIILNPTALGTAVTGELEYDGTVPYFTPSGTQRGVIPGMQYYRLDSAVVGSNATGAQKVLGVGVTLSAGTVYAFEAYYALSKTVGTTTHTIGYGFGGTATLNNIAYTRGWGYSSTAFNAPITAAGNMQVSGFVQTATSTTLPDESNSIAIAHWMVNVRGTVSVNAGGTFIPQYQLSAAPGGAYTTAIGSYFLIYPVGTAGADVSVGNWT